MVSSVAGGLALQSLASSSREAGWGGVQGDHQACLLLHLPAYQVLWPHTMRAALGRLCRSHPGKRLVSVPALGWS